MKNGVLQRRWFATFVSAADIATNSSAHCSFTTSRRYIRTRCIRAFTAEVAWAPADNEHTRLSAAWLDRPTVSGLIRFDLDSQGTVCMRALTSAWICERANESREGDLCRLGWLAPSVVGTTTRDVDLRITSTAVPRRWRQISWSVGMTSHKSAGYHLYRLLLFSLCLPISP